MGNNYQTDVQHNIHPDMQYNIQSDLQHNIHPDLQHNIHPDLQHDIHPNGQHDIYPDVHHEYLPEVHDYQHEYKAVVGHPNSDYQDYGNEHDLRYHYGPEHDYHDLSPGYHYLTSPPALPALPKPHPMMETPKKIPQETYYYLGRHLW